MKIYNPSGFSSKLTGSFSGSFVGDGSNITSISSNNINFNFTALSSSAQIAEDISGSFNSLSSSIASDRLKNTTDTLTGDLTVTGTITAQEFHTEFVSASIIYESGSTKFGDTSDDVHEFTGSINLSGSIKYSTPTLTVLGQSSDGADNQAFFIGAGGAGSDTRGAYIWGRGNEATNGGKIQINAGNVSTGNIELYTGGSMRMFVSSSGNVGIGNTNPLYPLHISSTSVYQAAIKSTGAQYLLIGSNDAGGAGIILDGDSNGDGAGGDYSYIVHETSGVLKIQQDSPAGTNEVWIGSGGTEGRLILDADGRLLVGATAGRGGGTTGHLFKMASGDIYFEIMANSITSQSDILFSDATGGDYGLIGYDHSNDSMRFYTNSDLRINIDSSGDIGLGVTDGDIFGRFYGRSVGIGGTGIAKLQINGTSYSGIDLGQSGTRYSEINCSATNLNIATIANIPIIFGTGTGATERMRITSGGDVEIQGGDIFLNSGTNYNDKGVVYLSNERTAIISDIVNLTANGDTSLDFQTRSGGSTSSAMFIDEYRKIGIGTTGPTEKLHILGGKVRLHHQANGYGWIYAEDVNHSLIMRANRAGTVGNYTHYHQYGGDYSAGGGHHFWTGGALASQSLRFSIANDYSIFQNTYVGIGTTSPTEKLHVQGNIRAIGGVVFDVTNTASGGDYNFLNMGYNGSWNGNQNGAALIDVNDGSGTVGAYGVSWDGNKGYFVIKNLYNTNYGNSGTVVKIRPDVTYLYNVYGRTVGATNRDVYIGDGGDLGYLSSTRESKMNISSIADTDWLLNLNPVQFNRRLTDDSGSYTENPANELEYGLIADEVETINSDVVFYDVDENGDKTLAGVAYRQLTAPLLKLVQQQQAKIQELENRIQALEV